MEITTEILKNYKLKFPWTKADIDDLIKSSLSRPAYKDFNTSNFIRVFKSLNAIEGKNKKCN